MGRICAEGCTAHLSAPSAPAALPHCCGRQAGVEARIEQADLLTLRADAFPPHTAVFCYLLPAGLAKLAPLLREVLATRRCALCTLRWPAPGLEDLRLEAPPGTAFHVYCSPGTR